MKILKDWRVNKLKKLIEELDKMIDELTDTSKIGHMKDKLSEIDRLYHNLDTELRSYENEINRLAHKVSHCDAKINKLKRVIITALSLQDVIDRKED